ncbi:hypothetical protein HF670_12045 [Acidithiobacillus thiooxidans]|uniref:Lipoprotein n=1 Tax=Acidithiobacillus thiooxidans TaxID=930 RepID=A0A1C2I925_ACITH|nr:MULTISPECIES: hypothetical protein [Acidithiobacillus]MBU2840278.1 hypothetical protein [Acidithiobacillus thiooxidans]MBU2844112.1 hypothetical protein [Acidithiobacillus thiooxidans]MDA8175731.1 hypothetical protein [Acidithiobacillus sp.]OCX72457.1 hypothetical protein A6P07_09660 [Acidithiobacillus thiooxidans]OCX74767.1 hypothetical protein A6M23_05210 [Acidithiobacillus thiooxidans]
MRYSKIAARLGLAMLLATGLAACSHEYNGPYPGHSVAWYTKHHWKAQKQMHWCSKIDREGNRSIPQPTCKNANTGFSAAMKKELSGKPNPTSAANML